MKKNPLYWRLCTVAVIIISVITFTPLVIPQGVYKPMLGGIPYSLWTGILIAWLLVLVTYLATLADPRTDNEDPS